MIYRYTVPRQSKSSEFFRGTDIHTYYVVSGRKVSHMVVLESKTLKDQY